LWEVAGGLEEGIWPWSGHEVAEQVKAALALRGSVGVAGWLGKHERVGGVCSVSEK
jgi:hypothetical protein